MARVSIPLLGQASGKFADAEFLTLKGQKILRSKKLKRYKPKNSVNVYYQSLLKLIVLSASPIVAFLKQSYSKPLRLMNYFNRFIHDNYSLFYLNSSLYLFCSDITKLRFSTPDFYTQCEFTISSYSATQLEFLSSIDNKYLLGDYDFYLVLCTDNFRRAQMTQCSYEPLPSPHFVYFYPSPPFNSSNYHAFFILKKISTNEFSNSIYAFYFSH